ncbi:MAG: hypothetical protein ACI9JM_000009 [Halioglobus sp.]
MQFALLFVVLVLGVIIMWRFFFPAKIKPPAGDDRERRTGFSSGNPFHAVSIRPQEQCCREVGTIKVLRFLSEDAPPLPLPGCNAASCGCKYVHHADRRDGARDRRLGAIAEPEAAEFWRMRDRRAAPGRRDSDLQMA